MDHRLKLVFTLILVLMLTGCTYVHTRTPYDQNLDKTDLGSKVGTAEAYSLFWVAAWGDASYAAAAKNGNIKILKHADQETLQICLGLYMRWRVIVYGD